MCYNCGCFNPTDDMGSDNNITEHTLEHLAGHWGKSLEETKKELLSLLSANSPKLESDPELKEMFASASKVWGGSLEEAHQNTLELLKTQVK